MRKFLIILILLTLCFSVSVTFAQETELVLDFGSERNVSQGIISNGCARLSTETVANGGYFGNVMVDVVLYSDSFSVSNSEFAREVLTFIHNTLTTCDEKCNVESENSDVARFNALSANKSVNVSSFVVEVFKIAKQMYQATDGFYNPCVYPLVDLWGFSARTYHENGDKTYDREWQDGGAYPLPNNVYVSEFSKLLDFESIELTINPNGDGVLTKRCDSVTVNGEEFEQQLDFGGIAKGYCADLICNYLLQNSISNGYVSIGSSSIYVLQNEQDEDYRVGLQHPKNLLGDYAQINLKNEFLSTSGQYLRCYSIDGVSYSHIINPQTGAPATGGIISCSVWGVSSAVGDCLTTAICSMNKEQVINFVNSDYFVENEISFVALAEKQNGYELITNQANDTFFNVSNDVVFGSKISNGEVVLLSTIQIDWIALTCIICAIVLAFVLCFVILKKRDKISQIENAKKSKLFVLNDVVLYVIICVLVITFLLLPLRSQEQVEQIFVIDMVSGQTVLAFDFSTRTVETFTVEGFSIEWTDENNKITVTVMRHTQNEVYQNTIVFERANGLNVAKMIGADCKGQDCVYSFEQITSQTGVIVCIPNHLKVVATQGGAK